MTIRKLILLIASLATGYALLGWVLIPIIDAADPSGTGTSCLVVSALLVTAFYILRMTTPDRDEQK